MKRIILSFSIPILLLLLAPLAVTAQKGASAEYRLDPRLYKAGKSVRDEAAIEKGKAPYIAQGNKPNIGTAEAVFCNQEFCEFKFGIFVERDKAGEAVSVPVIVSTVNGDKKYIQQNLKAEFAKNGKEARLIFKVRLFFGNTNTVNVGVNHNEIKSEDDKTDNFYKFFFNLVKD